MLSLRRLCLLLLLLLLWLRLLLRGLHGVLHREHDRVEIDFAVYGVGVLAMLHQSPQVVQVDLDSVRMEHLDL